VKVTYFSDTDTALLEFSSARVVSTREITPDVVVDLDAHGRPAEPRGHGGELRGGNEAGIDKRRGEHVPRHARDAFEEQDPAHRGAAAASRTARTTWHAAKPAEKPLSMLVTVTPGAQQLSMASSALSPPKLAP